MNTANRLRALFVAIGVAGMMISIGAIVFAAPGPGEVVVLAFLVVVFGLLADRGLNP